MECPTPRGERGTLGVKGNRGAAAGAIRLEAGGLPQISFVLFFARLDSSMGIARLEREREPNEVGRGVVGKDRGSTRGGRTAHGSIPRTIGLGTLVSTT
ncbi:hypothetical protein Poly30_24860 [Planctomycetes bacterium Poly30]|uniref:Uncharacterized protein n=1 Tax=Saltatorellus ferox TaxID=2528018 RepID=A0A518ESA2_9BACT|nr:hypothetical protein Poly30_24860 [Planctomycetes bacterium Poly30]